MIKFNTLKTIFSLFTASDSFRRVLTSVGVAENGSVCATDTHILAWTGELAPKYQATDKAALVGELARLSTDKKPSTLAELDVDPATFALDGSGQFPWIERVIPHKSQLIESPTYFDADELMALCKLAKANVDKSSAIVGLWLNKKDQAPSSFIATGHNSQVEPVFGLIMSKPAASFALPYATPEPVEEAKTA